MGAVLIEESHQRQSGRALFSPKTFKEFMTPEVIKALIEIAVPRKANLHTNPDLALKEGLFTARIIFKEHHPEGLIPMSGTFRVNLPIRVRTRYGCQCAPQRCSEDALSSKALNPFESSRQKPSLLAPS